MIPYRQFIFLGACVLAACLTACQPEAATRPGALATASAPTATGPAAAATDEFVFIQAGDPQIGGWTDIATTQKRFIELTHRANALRPAFVMVVGDLVNDGPHARELAAYDEALKEFRVPVHMIPGNHDNLDEYRKRFGDHYYSFTQGGWKFVCVNSTLMEGFPTRTAVRDQWDWLADTLADAQAHAWPVILVMHHTPQTMPIGGLRLEGLIHRYGVHTVLAGHIHQTIEREHRGYRLYTVAGSGYAMDKNGLGYRVFRVKGNQVEQEYVRLDGK